MATKGTEVVLLSTLQYRKETFERRETVKQPEEKVQAVLLNNGNISTTFKSCPSSGSSISLCESECISISKQQGNSYTLYIDNSEFQIQLSSSKKALMNQWYDTVVEVLNNLGFTFAMEYDPKINRKVALLKQIKPKYSKLKKKLTKTLSDPTSGMTSYKASYSTIPPSDIHSPEYQYGIYRHLPNTPSNKYQNEETDFEVYEPICDKTTQNNIYGTDNEYLDIVEGKNLEQFNYQPDAYVTAEHGNVCNKAADVGERVGNVGKRTKKLNQQVKQRVQVSIDKKKLDSRKIILSMLPGNCFFIASVDPSLKHDLYEGDMVMTINNQRIDSVEEAMKYIQKTDKGSVEMELIRLPYAEIVTIHRPEFKVNLGFKLDKRKVESVEEGGLAGVAGLRKQTMKATQFGGTTSNCITFINEYPLDRHCTPAQTDMLLIEDRGVVTLVVQPLDLIKYLEQAVDSTEE
ncbi:uncharacterized protein [Antedon mediterranea]|uniref:uncharacterized protein n=1 Tax=Antedon mediterranea TaxID=105859 RepID=UPI003AF9597C